MTHILVEVSDYSISRTAQAMQIHLYEKLLKMLQGAPEKGFSDEMGKEQMHVNGNLNKNIKNLL